MIRMHFKIVVMTVFILLAPLGAGSVEWKSLGYGTLNGSSRFDVFVDTESIRDENGRTKFWQGHVFYEPQRLPSGKTYVRVTVLREVSCPDNTDSSTEALFYGADGSIVERYTAGGNARFSPVTPDTISGAVLQFVCNYRKTDR